MNDLFTQLTFILFNNFVLPKFNLRVTKAGTLIYFIRSNQFETKVITTYGPNKHEWFHHVIVTDQMKKVFEFLELDHDVFEKGFKDTFEYFSWITSSPFISRTEWVQLKKYLDDNSDKISEELYNFCQTVVNHVKLNTDVPDRESIDNSLLSYNNLPELVVRSFFKNENGFESRLLITKHSYLANRARNKFTSVKILEWLPLLRQYPVLLGRFSAAFVNYVTDEKPVDFPKYLVDREAVVIKRDAISFYNRVFVESEDFMSFFIEDSTKEEDLV